MPGGRAPPGAPEAVRSGNEPGRPSGATGGSDADPGTPEAAAGRSDDESECSDRVPDSGAASAGSIPAGPDLNADELGRSKGETEGASGRSEAVPDRSKGEADDELGRSEGLPDLSKGQAEDEPGWSEGPSGRS